MNKSKKIREIEKRIGELIENYLHREYIENPGTIQGIAANLEIPYGTLRTWMKKLDITIRPKGGSNRKRANPLENRDNAIAEAKRFMEENDLNVLPGCNVLQGCGYSALSSAINHYHGGFPNFRLLLGQEQLEAKKNIWKGLEYALEQAEELMEEEGLDRLPGEYRMRKLGRSSLAAAIMNYHGRFQSFRETLYERMGIVVEEKENAQKKKTLLKMPKGKNNKQRGYWKSRDNAINESISIMEQNGLDELPTKEALRDLGHHSLAKSILKYHGGFQNFRLTIAEHKGEDVEASKQKIEEIRKVKDRQYALQKAKRIIEEEKLEDLPSEIDLKKMGYNELARAISAYHGGYPNFRRLHQTEFGISSSRTHPQRKKGVWKNLDFVISEVVKYLGEKGYDELPSNRIVVKDGYATMGGAIIQYHGGYKRFRKVLHERGEMPNGVDQLEDLLDDYIKGSGDND